jgi:carbon monoxide dehydrogenase subunit G
MKMTVSRDVAATPEAVWTVITDLDRSPEVLSGVQQVERLDDDRGFGIGTRWRETRTVFGREATEQMEVTAIDPGTSYTVTSVNGRTTYTSVLRVEALRDERTLLTMTFEARPTGIVTTLLGATLGRLFQPATRKMLDRDLADIAEAASAPAP